MHQYLKDGMLPAVQDIAVRIQSTAPTFQLWDEPVEEGHLEIMRILNYVDKDGTQAPYLEVPFCAEFVQQMHEEFSHLRYPGLLGLIHPRAWWPTVSTDIKYQAHHCPACQVSQTLQPKLEQETAQHQVRSSI